MHIFGPWRRRAVGAGLALALAGAFGVGMLLSRQAPAAPFYNQSQPEAAGALPAAGQPREQSVFLAYFANPQDGTLESQAVLAPAPLAPAQGLALALRALCQGPTPEMQRLGITSAVPTGCRINQVVIQDGRLQLDASRDFYAVKPEEIQMWQDQIEMTAAQVPGIRQVVFRAGGRPLSATELRRLGLTGPLPVDGRPSHLRIRRAHESSMA